MKGQNTFNNTMTNESLFINYMINNTLLKLNTIFPAKITAISGLRATVETIINPTAVNQASPPPLSITDVPIMQLRGGNAGVITEYKVGDVVMCGAVQRDISGIKKFWTRGNPSSLRKFSYSDTVILFYAGNDLPSVFVKITDNGIDITASGKVVNVNAATVNINANVNLGGSGGAKVLTEDSIITAPNGICTISNPATKVSAV